MPNFAVILPAAGKSSRLSVQNKKKVFLDLENRPVWLRSADHFTSRDDVVQTLVVIAPDDIEMFKEKFAAHLAFSNIEIVPGGAERADSVRNALARVREEVDFVAVHDAARPLLVKDWIDQLFQVAAETGAALPAIPITSTIKRVNSQQQITETVPRDGLWQAQTPQVFRRELLLQAYAQQGALQPTDEAQLMEQFGQTVTIVEGSPLNIKITLPSDLPLAQACLAALPKPSILRPLHPFADEPDLRW